MNRNHFLKYLSLMGGGAALFPSLLYRCSSPPVSNAQVRDSSSRGHLLREGKFPPPSKRTEIPIAILGGGVAGLSAARVLSKAGRQFKLLELEPSVGGNSAAGENACSAYPLGAHYLPLTNTDNKSLLEFLQESEIVLGYENGKPIYHEEYLCGDPDERIFHQGLWQTGLVPMQTLSEEARAEFIRFGDVVENLRQMRGTDGKYVFAIPVDESSTDEHWKALDTMSIADWMKEQGFVSEELKWYVDYCTRDDFGTAARDCSAWTGLHYFAGRKGEAANASADDVLTWPEGNYFLVKKLLSAIDTSNIVPDSVVYHLAREGKKVVIRFFNPNTQLSEELVCDECINALPIFIHRYFGGDLAAEVAAHAESTSYAPWLVANLWLSKRPQERQGAPLSWDNVLYGKNSLGYVNACHQHFVQNQQELVLTFYKALSSLPPAEARKEARDKTADMWKSEVLEELKIVHPNVEELIKEVDIKLWGHAMIRPTPGAMWTHRVRRNQDYAKFGNMHMAHADHSGISIFEEAFHRGTQAAFSIINHS